MDPNQPAYFLHRGCAHKPGDEPVIYTAPKPPRPRQGHVKLKKGDAGYRFLEKLREGKKKKPT